MVMVVVFARLGIGTGGADTGIGIERGEGVAG